MPRVPIAVLIVALSAAACRPTYVIVTIDDPKNVASGADVVAVGFDREGAGEERALAGLGFPATFALARADEQETEVFVEVLRGGAPVARGSAVIESGRRAGVTVLLAADCQLSASCSDGLYCNGEERCIERACQAAALQDRPCPWDAVSCLGPRCIEEERRCGELAPPPSLFDGDPCTVESCGEAGEIIHRPAPDGFACHSGPFACDSGACAISGTPGDVHVLFERTGVARINLSSDARFVLLLEEDPATTSLTDGILHLHDLEAPGNVRELSRGELDTANISDDGAVVVFRADRTAMVWDGSGPARPLLGEATGLSLSPNGRLVAVGGVGTINVFSPSGSVIHSWPAAGRNGPIDLGNDAILYHASRSGLEVRSLDGALIAVVPETEPYRAGAGIEISNDGLIVLYQTDDRLNAYNVSTGEKESRAISDLRLGLSSSADGTRVAARRTASGVETVLVWDLSSMMLASLAASEDRVISSFAMSPNGRMVVFSAQDDARVFVVKVD